MRTQNRTVRIQGCPLRDGRRLGVNAQYVVAYQAWMYVYMQVRNFLERCLANGVPKTQALIWKSACDCPSDARHHGHERGACGVVKLAHIMKMLSRNDERVARVKLP